MTKAEQEAPGSECPMTGVDPLAVAFGANVPDEQLAGRVRGAQIRAVLRLTPYTLLANGVNVLVVAYTCLGRVNSWILAAWACVVLVHLALGIQAWWRGRRRVHMRASSRALSASIRHATILALMWGILPLLAVPHLDEPGRLLISCLMCGMICAGGFALATVPGAVIAWVFVLGAGSVAGLLTLRGEGYGVLMMLLSVYCWIVIASAMSTARLFVERFLIEADLEHKGEVIKLLLNEFEETSSDWLWETDRQGRIERASPRFIAASGRSAGSIQGADFLSLLVGSGSATVVDDAIGELAEVMAEQHHFRDLVVPVFVGGDQRWWALTGKPFQDARGLFGGYRGVASDVTDQRRAAALVAHMAEHDSLTGLGNRPWFRRRVEAALGEAAAGGRPAVLFIIDLDHFKSINDTKGHPIGDTLLVEVARRFRSACPGGVALARIGGDEFAALGRFGTSAEAEAFAQAVLASLATAIAFDRYELLVGATIGIASGIADGGTVDDLMRRADIALYEAKRAGRGRALRFSAAMEREILERRRMETDLRADIARGRLEMAFQPIVSAHTEVIVAYEALLRWNSETWGQVSPAIFVPLAEEAGLIDQIGDWVLRQACRTAATWHDSIRVAVNLSAIEFHGPRLTATVMKALAESGLAPARLELEITETVLMRDTPEVAETIAELNGNGVRIALDDFGTGYSSLSYLRRYPFAKIKIDRSFTAELNTCPETLAITRAIVMLARSLDMEITAEGVETRAQADMLRALGCDTLQGFLFGRPSIEPARDVERVRFVAGA